jgi:hypothetical protein
MVEGPHGGCPLSGGVFTREVVALPYRLVVLSNQLLGDRLGSLHVYRVCVFPII